MQNLNYCDIKYSLSKHKAKVVQTKLTRNQMKYFLILLFVFSSSITSAVVGGGDQDINDQNMKPESQEATNEMILSRTQRTYSSGKRFILYGAGIAALGTLHPHLSGASEPTVVGAGVSTIGLVSLGIGLRLCAKAFKSSREMKKK